MTYLYSTRNLGPLCISDKLLSIDWARSTLVQMIIVSAWIWCLIVVQPCFVCLYFCYNVNYYNCQNLEADIWQWSSSSHWQWTAPASVHMATPGHHCITLSYIPNTPQIQPKYNHMATPAHQHCKRKVKRPFSEFGPSITSQIHLKYTSNTTEIQPHGYTCTSAL